MHSCPICDEACYCNGDFEDVDAGDEEAADDCTHCCLGEAHEIPDDYDTPGQCEPEPDEVMV